MKKLYVCAAMIVVFALSLTLVGCPKTPDAPGDGDITAPTNLEDDAPADEPTDDDASADTGGGVTLTTELVDGWVAATKDDAVGAIMDEMEPEGDSNDPAAMAAAFDAMKGNAELEEAVKAHGFSGADEFVEVTKKVMSGMMTSMIEPMLEMAKSMGGDEAGGEELAEAEAQLKGAKEALGELTAEEMEIVEAAIATMNADSEGTDATEDAEPTE
ncbi:MAG TPA: hypothetical protein QGH10_07090 [Armatimonadota bacterium]|nr:hypothetical protein [Armatimonadota bacterium]